MRIVFDLQACQSRSSRNRGIGRYSLALTQAIARQTRHDLWLVLNDRFSESIPDVLQSFAGLVPANRIVVFSGPERVAYAGTDNEWRIRAAELVRTQFLSELSPDWVYTSSIAEGLGEDALTGLRGGDFRTAATLYDLIPLIHSEVYLRDRATRDWYYRKLQQFKSTDLLLSISAYSRQEAIEALGIREDAVVNISAGVDPAFKPIEMSADQQRRVRAAYGLHHPFVMYTGGVDFRKNLEGLVAAYAQLPEETRANRQLAIVCSITDVERAGMLQTARSSGLRDHELVLTGYVPQDDLIALYNLCELFVFPSIHEGFGLPPLEAMACGAPVIGSNRSSIPEVIGRADALFDPLVADSVTAKTLEALSSEAFRSSLREHGLRRSQEFSWDRSAARTLEALDRSHRAAASPRVARFSKPRLAFVSPAPPIRSGIAAYTAELLPDLEKHYEIDLIVDQEQTSDPWLNANFPGRDVAWFKENAQYFDRIVYQLGNSVFHKHMFDLIEQHPGVVVLHDFFLSGVFESIGHTSGIAGFFQKQLYLSHGFPALVDADPIENYPANKSVIDMALGVLVHSQHSFELADRWLGEGVTADWRQVPQLRAPAPRSEPKSAKAELGYADDAFLICSFGIIHRNKQNELLLDAFLGSDLAEDPRCHLIFVGEAIGEEYGQLLQKKIETSATAARVRITGFLPEHEFRLHLQGADLAVQLRQSTRGETSRSALDVMGHGIPLIVNACGSMNELPDDCVVRLNEHVGAVEIATAMKSLWRDDALRHSRADKSRAWVAECHHPAAAARSYFDAIENIYANGQSSRRLRLLANAVSPPGHLPSKDDVESIIECVGRNAVPRKRRLFVDTSGFEIGPPAEGFGLLAKQILITDRKSLRIEPFKIVDDELILELDLPCAAFGVISPKLPAYRIDLARNDILLIALDQLDLPEVQSLVEKCKNNGVEVFVGVAETFMESARPDPKMLATLLNGALCSSEQVARSFQSWLGAKSSRLKIGTLPPNDIDDLGIWIA